MTSAQNITTQSDYDELSRAYKFVLEEDNGISNDGKADANANSKVESRWQDRMVQKYHQHLYKTHVIADLSQFKISRIGLRWRTLSEVASGKGVDSCGNKHCPCYFENKHKKMMEEVIRWKDRFDNYQALNQYLSSYKEGGTNQDEIERLEKVPCGLGLSDYEVHFAYEEQGKKKEELVKLKLCLRCAPKIFFGKGDAIKARIARQRNMRQSQPFDETKDEHYTPDSVRTSSNKKSSDARNSNTSADGDETDHNRSEADSTSRKKRKL